MTYGDAPSIGILVVVAFEPTPVGIATDGIPDPNDAPATVGIPDPPDPVDL